MTKALEACLQNDWVLIIDADTEGSDQTAPKHMLILTIAVHTWYKRSSFMEWKDR